jgi:site-specific DNA-methyltransferase (adenine-specific)
VKLLLKCQDAIAGMAALPDECVDVVVTSPPYNIGTNYGVHDDNMPLREYLEWTRNWLLQVKRILKPSGSFFLNVHGKPTDPLMADRVANEAYDHFDLQNRIAWVKSITIDGDTRGHVKPLNSPRFLNDAWETIYHFTADAHRPIDRLAVGVPYKDKSNLTRGKRGKHGDLRCGGNVWFLPYCTKQAKLPHPAPFPVELPLRCIQLAGVPEDPATMYVVDPFVGIGATGVACAQLGVNFLGFDVDREYLNVALTRMWQDGEHLVSYQ